jgi:hypothetical protein
MASGQSRKGIPRTRGALMSEAAFARLWSDPAVHVADIARTLGITRQAVAIRARVRGLPPRKGARKAVRDRVEDRCPDFAALWTAGVGLVAMMEHLGCCHTAILKAAARLGLPKRRLTRWNALTMADYRATLLRDAMAASARETRAAMKLAEMVDGRDNGARNRSARWAA